MRVVNLRQQDGNDRCADCQDCDCERCGFPDPVWACDELGILVCEECKSLHESITRHEFKSILKTDEWTEEFWQKMEATNNVKANKFYENRVPAGYQKPTRCFRRAFRENWLVAKYIKRHFVDQGVVPRGSSRRPNYLIGLKKGYLWKRGRDDSMFQRRWFLVSRDGASLVYYSDANEQSRRGDISLTDVHVCLAPEDKIQHPNGLQLIIDENKNNTRMIYLYADRAEDMVEWYQSICILKYIVTRHRRPTVTEQEILKNLNHKVKLEGFLWKTGGSRGTDNFKRRWFILHGRNLMYFDKPLNANPIKTVKLGSHNTGFSLITTGEVNPERKGFHFRLKTPNRVYHLVADTEHERQAWFTALFSACNRMHDGRIHDPLPEPPRLPRHRQAPLPSLPPDPADPARLRSFSLPVSGQLLPGPVTLPRPQSPRPIPPPLPPVEPPSDPNYIAVRDEPPPVAPRPPHTLLPPPVDSGCSSGSQTVSETESTTSSSEDYYECDQEIFPVISTKVDSHGVSAKAYGFCLRIPQGAMNIEGGRKCFLSVTPLQTECTPLLSEVSGMNVHGSQVVECRSFNYCEPLRKPLQLEIPHCAIIGDVKQCQVKLWHRKTFLDEIGEWNRVSDSDIALAYRLKQRCLQITTLHMGSYAFLVDGPGIRGKTMQVAVFVQPAKERDIVSEGPKIVTANIYIFNNLSSDSVWTSIEKKECKNGGILSNLSASFLVQHEGSALSMTIHSLDNLTLSAEHSNIVQIDSISLWQNPYTKYSVEFELTGGAAKATITLHQNDAAGNEAWQEDVLFTHSENEHEHEGDDIYWRILGNLPDSCASPSSISNTDPVADDSPYMEFFMPAPSRHASERSAAQRQHTLRSHHAAIINRGTPTSRTAPPLRRGRRSTRSTSSTETSSTERGIDTGNALPYQLKEDLGVLLDDWAAYGNDWGMLAKYVGLEHMMYRFGTSDHPTMTVLSCFEKLNLPLTYLEQALRDIDRDDAASLVKRYMPASEDV